VDSAGYRPRLIDPLISELLQELPALSILGPRASGKTTTALRHARTVIRLDQPREAGVFRADPDVALGGLHEPVLLDEWQEVPEVLGAVKRAVDADPRPGRFILTGSVHAELRVATWPGTGRIVDVPLTTLSVRERIGDPAARSFLDRMAEPDPALPNRIDGYDLGTYVDLALTGGFPEPVLRLTPQGRRRWFSAYVRQLTTRDVAHLAPGRDPQKLRRFLAVLAHSTAGIVGENTIYNAAGVNPRTAAAYERLLQDLYILDVIPAWSFYQLKRLASRPKRYLTDTALAAALMQVDQQGVLRDSGVLGRLIDTFVAAQLRAELAVSATDPTLYHLRDRDGREIDLLVEYSDGRIVCIEVKSGAAPTRDDARHLARFRDELSDRFVRGLVLHTGPGCIALGDRIHALPIAAIWT
jgi:predicted AAA+ superfamily ATPase